MQNEATTILKRMVGAKILMDAKQVTKDFYAERRIRYGKTAKDHARGAKKNSAENKQARDSWCQNPRATAAQHPSGSK